MAELGTMLVLYLCTCACLVAVQAVASSRLAISMPDVRPDHKDQYLCTAHRLPVSEKGQFVVGFEPHGDMSRVHHMLLYGCQFPGVLIRDTPDLVWDCGQMHSELGASNAIKSYDSGSICSGYQQILYGWALGAPALKLPDQVGFLVGGYGSMINFLVLQVHYGHYEPFEKLPSITDNSGLVLDMRQDDKQSGITKRAGILLLASLGEVVKGISKHEIWCDIKEDIEMHPFRYRTHTHKLGTKVMGARLAHKSAHRLTSSTTNSSDLQHDLIIGAGDPQKPQMFYPIKDDNIVIKKGDTVYAHCEFNNSLGHAVQIGDTGDDEMCNFYLMYWTNRDRLLERDTCMQQNPKSIFDFLS